MSFCRVRFKVKLLTLDNKSIYQSNFLVLLNFKEINQFFFDLSEILESAMEEKKTPERIQL